MDDDTILWHGPEYKHKNKTVDWFWAVGIIAVSGTVASILFKNYLFAIFLIVSTFLLFVFSIKKPKTLEFELTKKGIRYNSSFIPFHSIKAFWIDEDNTDYPMLYLETDHLLSRITSIPLTDISSDIIKSFLKKYIPFKEIEDTRTRRIIEIIDF